MIATRALLCLALPALASAFVSRAPTAVTRASAPVKGRTVVMESISDFLKFDAKLGELEVTKAGVSAPFGFFDPLNFYGGQSTRTKKKFRESELKHGRVAMMAVAGIFFQEIWHPLLAGDDFETALDQYYGVTEFIPDFGLGAMFVLSLFEFKSIAKGWDPIEETLKNPKIAGMRDDYVAGDLQYDPLGFCPDDDEDFITMRTKELNNGRMAMIAVIGIIAQEIVTGVPIVKSIFG
ncbi:hypothetical protein VYU27_000407 [Nannochloropsis oceanica]